MSRLLRLLSLLSFTICFTQSRLLENFKPTHVAGRSLPAQGTLLNDQLTDIYNQINVIQKPLNNVYQNPSGTVCYTSKSLNYFYWWWLTCNIPGFLFPAQHYLG